MEAPLEIRYAGVTIGRAQEVRGAEGDVPSFFIPARDPMPVGTVLRMRSGDHETPVRVVRAVETTDAAACGMQVRTIGEAEEVAPEFIPPPAAVAEKIKPGTPTPVVEVDLASMVEATALEALAPAESAASATIPSADPVATPAIEIVEATPAVETAALAGKAAGAASVESASSSPGEVAAVPEAVPVAVGSSVTAALRSATESVAVGETPSAETSSQASASPSPAPAGASQSGNGAVVEAAPEAGRATAEYGGQATELPPARPISGPSGRRKTKRRK
jgi:hypothetical protein